MAADTAARIIQVAQGLMATGGYHGTGTNAIIAAAGVSKGSFFHHFPDKTSLLVRALEDYSERAFTQPLEEAFLRHSKPKTALKSYTDLLFEWFQKTRFERGCLLGNMALELGDADTRITGTMFSLFEDWRLMLDAYVPSEQLTIPKDHFITLYIAAIEGVTMLVRIHKSEEDAEATFAACHTLLDMAFVEDGLPVLI